MWPQVLLRYATVYTYMYMNCVLHYNVRVVLYFSVHVHVTQELILVLTDMMLYSLRSLVQVFNPNIFSHMRQFS